MKWTSLCNSISRGLLHLGSDLCDVTISDPNIGLSRFLITDKEVDVLFPVEPGEGVSNSPLSAFLCLYGCFWANFGFRDFLAPGMGLNVLVAF